LKRAKWFIILGVLALVGAGLFATGYRSTALAAPIHSWAAQTNPPPQPGISNDDCLACHSKPDQYATMPNGDQVYITIAPETHNQSIHGQSGIACVQCHTDISGYPHPNTGAQSARELTIHLNKSCERCHSGNAEDTKMSTHQKAMDGGDLNAAVCSDCHSAHEVKTIPEDKLAQKQFAAATCERCHSQIHAEFTNSVHGNALINKNNPDVPTCIDCHGSHKIAGPTTNEYFDMSSPLLCQKCHADKELMSRYNLTADVFDTYVSDFHGSSVLLFEPRYPGQQSNKPVCIDCHGVHNMLQASDPNSSVYKDNILATCQRCHPDASSSFPAAWLGHYRPDLQKYPLYFFVDLFYKIFIPAVLGVLGFFVLIDVYRRFIRRPKENKNA
jgi:hypothetical protein